MGLGTGVIGSAVSAPNAPELKTELGIPATAAAVVPIIVGGPPPRRHKPPAKDGGFWSGSKCR
ncbi:hypothetical protein [Rugosibacter aromaticivorans]|uniref:hypothetical protein n=1 Tax=Rugosibacter aromaticivorans TaxID=1565605 RepID=UPI0039C8910E